ncbi:MAG: hypothetical protein V7K88_07300 [Nostoc sp.]|uniref:hypothetical protein n=1 Tax=Nostoc sp. TaxID=1180 RepID=UPI002FFB14AD
MKVLLLDECHLMWGDLSGYVWGKTDQEIPVRVVNVRDKETYYGAVDYLLGGLLLKAYNAGNSENTIDYLRYLLDQSPNLHIASFLGWCFLPSFTSGSKLFRRGKPRFVSRAVENSLRPLCS